MPNGFVLRYDTVAMKDACSFWLADAYVLRRDDARKLFERILSLRNDLGPAAKRLLGNFPQAFSHIALVNTAQNIARPEKPCEQRSGHSLSGSAA
jgi:GH15 family glucan-1,4-alpha-glucosidase